MPLLFFARCSGKKSLPRGINPLTVRWVTYGGARRNLEETFNAMEHPCDIADMEDRIFRKLSR